MKNRMLMIGLVLVVLAAAVSAAVVPLQSREDRVWIGAETSAFSKIEMHELTFTNATSSTATTTVSATGTWRALTGWKTNSANGEAKIGISGTTLTATSGTATTGTLNVMLIQGI